MCPLYNETHEMKVLMPILSGPLRLSDGLRCYGSLKQASKKSSGQAERNRVAVEGWQARSTHERLLDQEGQPT